MDTEQFLWVERYRPRRVADCILPTDLKNMFLQLVDNEELPNMLLCGGAGMGKTTVARALLDERDTDSIVINGSLDGNIDTLRNDILSFVTTMSLTGNRKCVVLDEADYLNPQSTQPALRNFIEEYSAHSGFILTCNLPDKILEPIRSRCSTYEFIIPSDEKNRMCAEFMKRTETILQENDVEYDREVIGKLILRHFPDFRKTLNELQKYSISGKIDTGILSRATDDDIGPLMGLLKEKNFSEMRKWVAINGSRGGAELIVKISKIIQEFAEPKSVPQAIITLADYQYKAAFASSQELNLAACLTELMADVSWK